MKNNKTQIVSPPFLRYSLISFQQYCNRDIFSQQGLLYSHQQNLYTNARNRRKVKLHARHPCFFQKETQNPSQRRSPSKMENERMKEKLAKAKRSQILNVTPAVIHSTASNRMSLMLSQRSQTQVKQMSRNKLQRSKTLYVDWNSQGQSMILKDINSPYYGGRPKTAGNGAYLNKIKVYLPCRPQTGKTKDEAIKPWDSYQEQGI